MLSEEAGTPAAVAEYRRRGRPRLFYLSLHALEVENAIRQRAYHQRQIRPASERGQIKRERDAALARLELHLQRGVFTPVLLDMDIAMERARELAAAHTDELGVRAVDVLHVACALLLESEVFLTADERQAALAKAEGLQVPALAPPA